MDEIKSCPFCLSEDVGTEINSYGKYVVGCEKCGADGPWGETLEMAIEKWNRRQSHG